jgi:hypothetical protein
LAFHARLDLPAVGLSRFFPSAEEGLIVIRVLLFSIYPLVFAVGLLKRNADPLDRMTLRAPFFSQCYLGAVFAIAASLLDIMIRATSEPVVITGIALSVVVVVWYVWIQGLWFTEQLKISKARGMRIATGTFLKASLINAAITWVLTR